MAPTTMNSILRTGLVTATAVVLSSSALAGDFIVRVEAVVDAIDGAGSLVAPFDAASIGAPLAVDYAVDYPGESVPDALFVNGLPVPGVEYQIDYGQSFARFGGQDVPLADTVPAPFEDGVSLLPGVNGFFGYAGAGTGFLSLSAWDILAPGSTVLTSGDLEQLAGTTVDTSPLLFPGIYYQDSFGLGSDQIIFRVTAVSIVDTRDTVGLNYCQAELNSTGAPATIVAAGSDLVSDNDFALTASGLPVNQFGIFVASKTQAFTPGANGSSNGNLCLGGAIGRFVAPGQIQSSGASGSFALTVDLTALPQGASTVGALAGETWNFQAWFRDAGGLGSNFTDGLQVDFR